MENQKIVCRVLFEMIGRPKEHLKKSMEDFLMGLGAEKDVKITSKKIHEPKKLAKEVMEKNKYNGEMFSTFSEIEIELPNIMSVIGLSFRYLPSHVEVISPENFSVDNLDINAIANEIINKIHQYDAIAKTMIVENKILSKHVEELIVENRNKSAPTITLGSESKTDKVKKGKKKK